ncbi:MAG: dual specificity protein phosphatase family protein [Armatimonadetes bacterium]|nr:dual specificity protein phosphatase family protein [Armatimonadota bacterium]
MTFHRVSGQLWVGGAMSSDDWRRLWDQGVTVSVNLRVDANDDFGDLPPEAALWVPTPERRMPDVDALMMIVGFVEAAMREGRRVVVHCRHGTGRSPLTAACCLMSGGMRFDEAMDAVGAGGVRVSATAAQVAVVFDFIRARRERIRDGR